MEHQSVDFQKPSFLGLWNAVSWNLPYLGVPSEGEKVVRRRLVEFLVFNSIFLKKSVPACVENCVWVRLRRALIGVASSH